MGEAESREQAERRAYAAVARVFSANVQSRAMDQESYAIQETGQTRRTQRELQLDHRTQVTTNKVLENVKVLVVWYQSSTRRFFALARLDRRQAEQVSILHSPLFRAGRIRPPASRTNNHGSFERFGLNH
jgi:hypothetical protein